MEHHATDNEFTNASEQTGRKKIGGAPANALFIPVVVVLAILNVIIIVLMFSMFTQSGKLSTDAQNSSIYANDATSLLAGSSVLSETSSNFVLMPITSKGELNLSPLNTYVNELAQTDHRGDQVLARFETYNVSDEVLQSMREAAQSSDALIEMERRAMALVFAVYPQPGNPLLESLDLPELTAEEAALPDDAKIELAQTLILNEDWGRNKYSVSSNVNKAVASIRSAAGEQAASASQSIVVLRTLLIVVASLIIVFLIFAFVLFYRMLISPLGRFSRLIVQDRPLDDERGLHEMRLLAGSYNDLLHRRNALEAILREAAETDTLTGLPNRYSLQQHQLDATGKGYALTVFMFDVDYLKQTNDTYGHAAGDDLIRRASYCISTCFASLNEGKCYRLSGDEFAATARNLDENEILSIAQEFEDIQKRNDVSISWGYAHAREIGDTSFRALMDEADRKMYQMKEEVHRSGQHGNPAM